MFQTKSQFAYTYLQKLIATGQWTSAERLTVHEIAVKIGTSETPVREALKRLQAEGNIFSISHSGYRVVTLNHKELQDLFSIRIELEGLAIKQGVPNIDSQLLSRLRQIYEQMKTYTKQGKINLWRKTNREFHRTLYQSCDNETLITLIQQLWERTNYARAAFPTTTQERALAYNQELSQLLSCLEKRDITGSLRALEYLLTNSLESILSTKT